MVNAPRRTGTAGPVTARDDHLAATTASPTSSAPPGRPLARRQGHLRRLDSPIALAFLEPWPGWSWGVLFDRHQPRHGRMGGVGAAHHPFHAVLVPQPHPRGPRARHDLVKRPAPVAHRAPRPAGPGAEALAEVQRADRPPHAAQRRLLAHQHPAHRPFRQHHRGTGAACRLGSHPPAGKEGHCIGRAHAPWVAGGSGASARHVLALLGPDEAVAPVGIEPLDGAARHDRLPPSRRQAASMVRHRAGTPQPAGDPAALLHWAITPLTSSARVLNVADSTQAWPLGQFSRLLGGKPVHFAARRRGPLSRCNNAHGISHQALAGSFPAVMRHAVGATPHFTGSRPSSSTPMSASQLES